MNEELDLLKIVTERLNKADIPYMISGSVACNYYTVPRMTRDIDIVIELKTAGIDRFAAIFQDDFYLEKETIRKEVSRGGMFNLIHNRYVIKVDFIIRKESEFQESAFFRRKKPTIGNKEMWFISAEDLILAKLLWSRDSHSEMQLKDVRNLTEAVKNLDIKYMDSWISKLGLEQLYKEAKS